MALLRDPFLYLVTALAALLQVPLLRHVEWLGDEGVVLHAGLRIVDGQMLYRDFFEFIPPGCFLIVATWMKLFGATLVSVRILAVLVLATIAALLYLAAQLACGRRCLSAALAIGWAVLAQGDWMVLSHHWMTTCAALAAAVALLVSVGRTAPGRCDFLSGLCAGTATLITSTRGALLCLAVLVSVLTLPGGTSRVLRAALGICVPALAVILYLAQGGALGPTFADVIVYPARHYVSIQSVHFGSFARWHDAAAVLFWPGSLALTVLLLVRTRGILRQARFRAALALALAGFIGTYPRPDVAHILFTLPLGAPLFALAAIEVARTLSDSRRRTAYALAAVASLVALGYPLHVKTGQLLAPNAQRSVATPRGMVTARRGGWIEDLPALSTELARIAPADPFFFYPYAPMLPYLTQRRHVGDLDVILPGYTTPTQFHETCKRVLAEARWWVIERPWTDPNQLRRVFPHMPDPNPPEKRDFEAALAQAFPHSVFRGETFELRKRGEQAAPSLCETVGAAAGAR